MYRNECDKIIFSSWSVHSVWLLLFHQIFGTSERLVTFFFDFLKGSNFAKI